MDVIGLYVAVLCSVRESSGAAAAGIGRACCAIRVEIFREMPVLSNVPRVFCFFLVALFQRRAVRPAWCLRANHC